MAKKYYIACYKNGRSIDQVLWWREDGAGYTYNLCEAGVYDAKDERVKSRIERKDTDNVPVECSLAHANAVQRVSTQDGGCFQDAESLLKRIHDDEIQQEKLKNFTL